MQITAASGIGSVQPGHGRVSGAAACRPISSNKSPAPVTGAGAAGRAAAPPGFGAAGFEDDPGAAGLTVAGLAAGAAAAGPPGIFSGCWQAGHLTVLPANSSFAANALPQAHCTLIGMERVENREKSAKPPFCTAGRISAMNRQPGRLAARPNSCVAILRQRN